MSAVRSTIYKDGNCTIKVQSGNHNKIIIAKKNVKLAVRRNYIKRVMRLLLGKLSKLYPTQIFVVIVFRPITVYRDIKIIECKILSSF